MASVYSELTALGLSISSLIKEQCVKEIGFIHDEIRKPTEANFVLSECLCNLEDMILVAEFSEVKGPIPLLTVPVNRREYFGLDIDDFILKIMSTDYQATASGHFTFSADTQVLQTDIIEGVHAYVHYFTFKDVMARGFVRPMCLAYISKNKNKLEAKVSFLRKSFLQVSGTMKEENHLLFFEEVSLSLQKLKDIQYRYFQWNQQWEDEEGSDAMLAGDSLSNINIDQLAEHQSEFSKILQSGRSILENSHLSESLSAWKYHFSVASIPEVDQYMKYVKLVVGNREHLVPQRRRGTTPWELRPIAALSPFGVAIGVWYLCQIHKHYDSCDLELWGGCFWKLDEGRSKKLEQVIYCGPESAKGEVSRALENKMYHQLLVQLLPESMNKAYGDPLGDTITTEISGSLVKESTAETIGADSSKIKSDVKSEEKQSRETKCTTFLRKNSCNRKENQIPKTMLYM